MLCQKGRAILEVSTHVNLFTAHCNGCKQAVPGVDMREWYSEFTHSLFNLACLTERLAICEQYLLWIYIREKYGGQIREPKGQDGK